MKILIEGEKYPLSLLEDSVDKRFYKTSNTDGVITCVGYFYSLKNNEVVYVLPKVFIDENKIVLFSIHKDELIKSDFEDKIKDFIELDTFKKILLFFYRSLLEYRNRNPQNELLEKNQTFVLDSNIGTQEYTYLDIILNIVNFHKKNSQNILFIEKQHRSNKYKKVNWNKTINKSTPYIDDQEPIYLETITKKKFIDNEEVLLSMFYSVLNYISKEYKFKLSIDKIYTIYTGKKFENLCKNANKILKKIKYKYFSDTLIRIYKLMVLYFDKTHTANTSQKKDEFILVDNYHIVFEDMIDKLFSDELPKELTALKSQKDGKVIDHLFEYDSLISDKEKIFYIGDSKYYKVGNDIEKKSKYKQFTYAKNVIQFNIDVINGEESCTINKAIRYRDDLTEGYSISPNFFIQGKVENIEFDNHNIKATQRHITRSYHFENRLFDRDTLFIHNYYINFLFVLKSYSQFTSKDIENFRKDCQKEFREDMINFLNQEYDFYKKQFDSKNDIKDYVNTNFRDINGKSYISSSEELVLILANLKNQSSDIKDFNKFILS